MAANRVADRQQRVIGAKQASICGLSRKAVATRCRRQSWTRLHPGAFLIGPGPPSYPARTLAAVLARWPGVAAGGLSSGWFNGMLERTPARVDLTVVDGRHRGPLEGVRIHQSRLDRRVLWHQHIPILSPLDTLFELAALLPPDELEAACALALRKHVVSRTALREAIDGSGRRPGLAALRRAAEAPRLTRSRYERMLSRYARMAELPAHESNVTVGGKELDLYWRQAKLGIEVDVYGTHGDWASFEDDRKLDLDMAAGDIEIRRVTGPRIERHPYAVIARIAALLTLKLGGLPPPRRR